VERSRKRAADRAIFVVASAGRGGRADRGICTTWHRPRVLQLFRCRRALRVLVEGLVRAAPPSLPAPRTLSRAHRAISSGSPRGGDGGAHASVVSSFNEYVHLSAEDPERCSPPQHIAIRSRSATRWLAPPGQVASSRDSRGEDVKERSTLGRILASSARSSSSSARSRAGPSSSQETRRSLPQRAAQGDPQGARLRQRVSSEIEDSHADQAGDMPRRCASGGEGARSSRQDVLHVAEATVCGTTSTARLLRGRCAPRTTWISPPSNACSTRITTARRIKERMSSTWRAQALRQSEGADPCFVGRRVGKTSLASRSRGRWSQVVRMSLAACAMRRKSAATGDLRRVDAGRMSRP